MSKIEVNQISSQCGSTLTIGQSGDTVTLACGATQTGFGRTGTVDWDTTAKTASFTAVSGNGYFVNTTSGTVTVTLPATPSAGDIVGIKDYAGTFETNNVTVGRNGSLIDATASDAILSTNNLSVFFVYVDGTQGWKATQSDAGTYGALYIVATGGTETTCGDYKIHTFTGPGTFTVCSVGNPAGSTTVDYMVVAGGGGGAANSPSFDGGSGGGGAGGFRESSGAASGCYTTSPLGSCVSALPVSAQGYPITVGGGGAGGTNQESSDFGDSGSNSVFSTITSTGGGGGGKPESPAGPVQAGLTGGSGGGGGSHDNPGCGGAGGAGNTPLVFPPQGNPGGNSNGNTSYAGGGGGGATVAGSATCGPPSTGGGPGGAGATTSISGSPTAYAGGGGGGGNCSPSTGGTGGGGDGGRKPNTAATAGTDNTGGGGGGSGRYGGAAGATGGSGIVIIRYKYQ